MNFFLKPKQVLMNLTPEKLDEQYPDIEYKEILQRTNNAIRFLIGEKKVWLPKSQIEFDKSTLNTINIPRWLAEKKGLI